MGGVISNSVRKHERGLAPMEGVTDFPTRLWFRLIGGMNFFWTPFLRVTDTFPAKFPESFAPELFALKGRFSEPTILQLMASRPEDVVRTAEGLDDAVPYVDLNCGCPSPTVVGSRAGSSWLENVDLFSDFVGQIVKRIGPHRLSVKMRSGFHREDEFMPLLTSICGLPLKHLTVHGRTRPQRYKGTANWNLVEAASRVCPFPIIGSGDIREFDGLQNLPAHFPDVHASIVGRGALRNPWIFQNRKQAPVPMALLLYIVMQDIYLNDPLTLIDWIAYDDMSRLEHADDFWRAASRILARAQRSTSDRGSVQCSPRALSRGKMMWNYLRSSLPSAFMEPALMRSSSVADLIMGMYEISRQSGFDPDNLALKYRPECDWMYSGEGRVASKTNDADQA